MTDTMERHYRRGGIVGPVILIGAGILFLLANMGRLNWSVWETLFRLWPVLLIAIGLDILIGRRSILGSLIIVVLLLAVLAWAISTGGQVPLAGQPLTTNTISQALSGAKTADVQIAPGVGQLVIGPAAEDAGLIEGQVAVAPGEKALVDQRQSGDTMYYSLRSQGTPNVWWPGSDPWRNKIWDLKLNRDVPMSLRLETGVGQATVDLSQIKVTNLNLNTGVGQSIVTLPAQGQVQARVDGGIGEVRIIIPAGVAARIHATSGLGETRVQGNFQRQGDVWTSPGYDSAANRVDLQVSGGIGSVVVTAS